MQTPRTCSTAEALIAEYDAANANVMRRYVHGPGTDEPIVWYEGGTTANKNWLYSDHLGSVVATANTTGASTATYTYGPYGEPNTATGIRFRYTGQQLIGELGLYYYKARFYSPALGRFLQTDPIGYKDDQNLYAYVGSNSVNRTDPSGLAAKEAAALAAALGSKALQGLDTLVTGGYGQKMNEAIAAGDYAAASLNLAAGVGYGAMNVATLGETAAGTVLFKTAHYVARLEAGGINAGVAEAAVLAEVKAMRANMVVGGDVNGRILINGVSVGYRARLLENGTVNVGTIFPLKK